MRAKKRMKLFWQTEKKTKQIFLFAIFNRWLFEIINFQCLLQADHHHHHHLDYHIFFVSFNQALKLQNFNDDDDDDDRKIIERIELKKRERKKGYFPVIIDERQFALIFDFNFHHHYQQKQKTKMVFFSSLFLPLSIVFFFFFCHYFYIPFLYFRWNFSKLIFFGCLIFSEARKFSIFRTLYINKIRLLFILIKFNWNWQTTTTTTTTTQQISVSRPKIIYHFCVFLEGFDYWNYIFIYCIVFSSFFLKKNSLYWNDFWQ